MLQKHFRSLERAVTSMLKHADTSSCNRNRKPYPISYREAIVTICRQLNSIRATASLVKPSASSICRWMRSIEPRKRAKGLSKITELMVAAIESHVFEHPEARACTIVRFLSERFNIQVSRQLVQTVLSRRLNFSFKRTRKRGPDLCNNLEYKARVSQFVKKLHQAFCDKRLIVSVDESGADQRCRPHYGYAKKGHQAILHHPPVSCPHHVRTSLIMAIASDGSRHHQLTNDKVGGDIFADFILSAPFPPGAILIMDNHNMHDTESVQVALNVKGYIALFTPPYSPEFNPIEMLFGTLKNKFYNFRYSRSFTSVESAFQQLIVASGTPKEIQNYIRHVQEFVASKITMYINEEDCQEVAHNVHNRWKGVRSNRHSEQKGCT